MNDRVRRVVNRRARRLTLRLSVATREVVLTVPPRVAGRQAEAFLKANERWVAARLASLPPAVPFCPGTVLPVMGVPLRLAQKEGGRGTYARRPADGGEVLEVAGDPALYDRRVRRWLAKEAEARFRAMAEEMAAGAGLSFRRVRTGDFRSRWGSCTARGDLSFSWRLLLAPPEVARTTVAHEVAHLAEMHHQPAFWALAERISGGSHEPARRWLRAHGALLHSYGALV